MLLVVKSGRLILHTLPQYRVVGFLLSYQCYVCSYNILCHFIDVNGPPHVFRNSRSFIIEFCLLRFIRSFSVYPFSCNNYILLFQSRRISLIDAALCLNFLNSLLSSLSNKSLLLFRTCFLET